MSRSYREPWETDGRKGSKRRQFYKRLSNKKIRRSNEVVDGNVYKKISNLAYDICDYRFLCNDGDKREIIAMRK